MDDRTIPSDLENTVAGLLGRTLEQASRIRALEGSIDKLLEALCARNVAEGVEIATALIASLEAD